MKKGRLGEISSELGLNDEIHRHKGFTVVFLMGNMVDRMDPKSIHA